MTLAPSDNRNVRAVEATRYPLNQTCSAPDCDQPADDPHHVWRRSAIGGDSWFVELDGKDVIPHVTGLCRKHHDDVTVHRSWIKLEEAGVFVWYDRKEDRWLRVGTLSPQPGSREQAPKRKRQAHKPAEARKKATFSVRVPKDHLEDGYEVLTGLIEAARDKLAPDLGWSSSTPPYFVLCAALAALLQEA